MVTLHTFMTLIRNVFDLNSFEQSEILINEMDDSNEKKSLKNTRHLP